jgi:hypothetical protein
MNVTKLRINLQKQGLSEADILLAIEAVNETLKEKTERILITVEGGLVQGVNSTFPCDTYVLDFDTDGAGAGDEQKLIDLDGERIDAYLYDTPCEVDQDIVSHYIKQI